MTTLFSRSAGRLRRYPALGFLAVAALLASLLPSALRVPLSGPTASAELAPVPGKSDVAQGDLSALGETSTGGLGSGSGLGGGDGLGAGGGRGPAVPEPDPGEPSPDRGSGRNPANKRCVGKPARQTEDPFSPPCVAFFKGDNFGATTKGVTGDEVRVVFVGCTSTSALVGHSEETDPNSSTQPWYAAYNRYFNDRFQTYGRRIRVWRWTGPCQEPRAATVVAIDQKLDPFAIVSSEEAVVREAASRGIVAITARMPRQFMQDRAPYVFSFEPDQEEWAASTAEFLCARLAGRRARFSPDPTVQQRTRRFGIVYHDFRSDPTGRGADLVRQGVRERCGAEAGEVVEYNDSTDGRARMRTDEVTTVLYHGDSLSVVTSSSSEGLNPEWFMLDGTGLRINTFARTFLGVAGAIGMTTARRVDDFGHLPYTVAMREGCSCGDVGDERIYNPFFLLFSGIQAAGPRLTAANIDRGLHAIAPRRSLDPRVPAAYFAPGNYSFVKDMTALRWHPSATRSGNAGPGCWLLVEGGLRYRPEDWASSPGDEVLDATGQPCQADEL